MRLGITGTRRGLAPAQHAAVYGFLRGLALGITELREGDCVGVDDEVTTMVWSLRGGGIQIIAMPSLGHPDLCAHNPHATVVEPPRKPLDRNRLIVDQSDHILACPGEFTPQVRGGTWYTIRYAEQIRRPLTVIFPDGSTEYRVSDEENA